MISITPVVLMSFTKVSLQSFSKTRRSSHPEATSVTKLKIDLLLTRIEAILNGSTTFAARNSSLHS
jgi:hypothetical protein